MSGSIQVRLLTDAAATGAGAGHEMQSPRNLHSLQVTLGGTVAATGVKVVLQGSNDFENGSGAHWFDMATWDLSAGQADGAIVSAANVAVTAVRANLETLTGGTAPTVSAIYTGESF